MMETQNEANGTASEPIARYDELPILRTYKVALENMVQIGGTWMVGNDGNIYHVEMPDKVKECMWKNAKRYDIQTGKVMGYTHYDEIRAMSVEELARFVTREDLCELTCNSSIPCDGRCEAKMLGWLKEEVEDESLPRPCC